MDYCTYLSGPDLQAIGCGICGYGCGWGMWMGMVRIYTYVGTYTYAYVPMQCVMLSRLYGFVGRQYCTYSYRRERGGNTTTTNDIRYIPTLVGVFITVIWENDTTYTTSAAQPQAYAIPRKSPREFPTRTQTRRFVSSFKTALQVRLPEPYVDTGR